MRRHRNHASSCPRIPVFLSLLDLGLVALGCVLIALKLLELLIITLRLLYALMNPVVVRVIR